MQNRRNFLLSTAAVIGAPALGGCAIKMPLHHVTGDSVSLPDRNDVASNSPWQLKLVEPLPKHIDHELEIKGHIPPGLDGEILGCGPNGVKRKGLGPNLIVDGDGLLTKLAFKNGKVFFNAKDVLTEKFKAEEKAGEFRFATWSKDGTPQHSQAGVAPQVMGDMVLAYDEVGKPYALRRDTLGTIGPMNPVIGDPATAEVDYKAHHKEDANGNTVLVAEKGRASKELHVIVTDPYGKKLAHVSHPNPRPNAYFHDFFWTEPYAIFHFSPLETPTIPVGMLAGFKSYVNSLEWKEGKSGLLFIVDTTGKNKPVSIEVPPVFSWHNLNAVKDGNKLRLDFVGYKKPDHFIGKNAAMRTLMHGIEGVAESPGLLQRFTVDLNTKTAQLETIAEERHEFPVTAPNDVGKRFKHGYMSSNNRGFGMLHNGVARVDVETGAQSAFHYDDKHYVGEPVYATDSQNPKQGWVITRALNGNTGKSLVSVFDAANIEKGAVGEAHFTHSVPMGFHATFQSKEKDREWAANEPNRLVASR